MKYTTRNEFEHFEFSEFHVQDVRIQNGRFMITVDDAIILPENSCNRDIRKMRANSLVLSILDAEQLSFVEEGYKYYDANGNFLRQEEDQNIDSQQYSEVMEFFIDANGYLIAKNGDEYTFVIDGTNERTYTLVVKGSGDVEEWDRFLALE